MCGFYVAAVLSVFERLGFEVTVVTEDCLAMGGTSCVLTVRLAGRTAA
jgi:hypothetical protein